MSRREETLERLQATLDGIDARFVEEHDRMPCVEVDRDAHHETLTRLRDRAGFESLTLVTGVDRLRPEEVRPREPRFEVVHQLRSLEHGDRVRIRTHLASDDAHVPSCTGLWPGAGFMERECYDMFGVVFDGHPNLVRLLMPDGYGHHPLRKDFPQQGIAPDRLYREWDRERRVGWQTEAEAGR